MAEKSKDPSEFARLDLRQDQTELLNHSPFQLQTDLRVGHREGSSFRVRNTPARTYLTVDDRQWTILKYFREPRTLPQVFPQLVEDRTCIPLREFYELVLKALQAGILLRPGESPRKARATDWNVEIGYKVALLIGFIGFAAGVFGVLSPSPTLPNSVLGVLAGYLMVLLSQSLGYFLGACVVRGFDCEVYNPQIFRRSLVPHFRIDLEDGQMAGPNCELAVAMVRMAPLLLCFGLTGSLYPQGHFILYLAVLHGISPMRLSPAVGLLKSFFRQIPLSVHREFVFRPNRRPDYVLSCVFKSASWKYLAAKGIFSLLWFGVFSLFVYYLLAPLMDRERLDQVFPVVLGGLVLVLAGYWLALGLIFLRRNEDRETSASAGPGVLRRYWGRLTGELDDENPDPFQHSDVETRARFLRQHPMLSVLSDREILQVAESSSFRYLKRGETVPFDGSRRNTAFLICRGVVDLRQQLSSGRLSRIHRLGPGDFFGDLRFLENMQSVHAKVVWKAAILEVPAEVFESKVIEIVGVDKVKHHLQIEAFLHRIRLTRRWPSEIVAEFSDQCYLESYAADEVIIDPKQYNQRFYIVYQGVFSVLVGGKRVSRLKQGDFLGEISILRNSPPTATVQAHENARCLVMLRNKFIQTIGMDYRVAMVIEEIASKRMGRPIYPLDGNRFGNITTN